MLYNYMQKFCSFIIYDGNDLRYNVNFYSINVYTCQNQVIDKFACSPSPSKTKIDAKGSSINYVITKNDLLPSAT